MPRSLFRLSAQKIRQLKPGTYADGGNLYLRVNDGGSKSWIFRYKSGDRVCQHGLGGFTKVGLADARRLAEGYRLKLASGEEIISPLSKRRAQQTGQTFQECAELFIQMKSAEWKNAKHKQQWENTLKQYAYPVIGKLPPRQINLGHIKKIIEPIWMEKTETADRLRGRIEAVLSYAHVQGLRGPDNPALWRGNLDKILPSKTKIAPVKHLPALPYEELPKLVRDLEVNSGVSSAALSFLILTATRSREVREMTWDELDFDEFLWTIPKSRMKNGVEHRVPLSDAAIGILSSMAKYLEQPLVFPSPTGVVLSDTALSKTLKALAREVTVHGMRSSFRGWCAEQTAYPDAVCELALAHSPKDRVQAAYQRSDLLAKRRGLMSDWARFLYP